MDFNQAESFFRQLDNQYRTGQINYDQYRAALAQMEVKDAQGNFWKMQEQTGAWFVYLQGQWVPMVPPPPATPKMDTPVPQNRQPDQPPPSAQATVMTSRPSVDQAAASDQATVMASRPKIDRPAASAQATVMASRPSGGIRPQIELPPQIPPLQQQSQQFSGQTPQFFAQPPAISTYPVTAQPPMKAYPPQYAGSRKKSPWLAVGIIGGSVIVLALLVVGLLSLIKGGGGMGRNVKTYNLQEQNTLTLNPGQTSIKDDRGTELALAPEALPAEDSVANLTIYEASGELERALSQSYQIETPFYEVSLEGQNDGNGTATLTFPAPDPNSRLLMIIDMQAAILLEAAPQNGVLTTNAHLGPTDLSVLYPDGETGATHSLLYVVVTPLEGTGYLPSTEASPIQMAGNRIPQENYGKMCSPFSLKAVTLFQRCQSNEDGTVMVIYPTTDKLTHIDAYHVAKEIEAAINTYYGMGFTNASLSASSPILAVVSDGYTSPEYNFRNGVVYLPPDIPVKLSSERTAIWHEIGHLIQNRVYSMAIARVTGARAWWIEVSAEMLVMDVMPEYIVDNMTTYGKITKGDNVMLAFQSAPYQFPADFYVHAQLVEVNMCDLGCPITRDDFVNAINKGLYPFNGNYEREMLTSNLEDYARYLLGFSPKEANTDISLAGVQNQDDWGQIITVSRTEKSLLKYTHNGVDPQIKEEKTQNGSNLIINAALEEDGVYPLQITSGSGGKYTGLPMMLVVEPGVPFLYRLDDGEEISSDGSKETKIGPLQAGSGVGVVRLVAFSKTGGQAFKAKIEPVNLDGTWVIIPSGEGSNNISCTGGGDSEDGEGANPAGIAMFGVQYFTFLGAMGEMTTDSSGQSLDWSLVPSRLPADVTTDDFTFEASAISETDGITLQGQLDLPKPADESGYIPGLKPAVGLVVEHQTQPLKKTPPHQTGLAVLVLLPAVGISLIPLGKKKQKLMIAIAIGLMALTLVGCFGFGLAFYGTINGDVKITKFEYAGGSGPGSWTFSSLPTGNPIWNFKEGTATFTIDFFIESSTTDMDGNETTTVEECSGTATYPVTGGVYEDMTVVIPSSD